MQKVVALNFSLKHDSRWSDLACSLHLSIIRRYFRDKTSILSKWRTKWQISRTLVQQTRKMMITAMFAFRMHMQPSWTATPFFFFFNQMLMMQRHPNQGNSGIWQAGKEKCNTMPLQTAVGIGARLLQTFSFCPHLMVPLNTMSQYQPRQQNLQHTN